MDFELLNTVANLERPDGVAAIPGDASYSLCCRVDHVKALARITRIKGSTEPMLLLGRDVNAFRPFLERIPLEAESLMQHYWPGPLILQLSKSADFPAGITGEEQIAVMQPISTRVLDLLSLTPGGILATTGACRYDDAPAATAAEVYNSFGDDVDYVLQDDGAVFDTLPATIVSVGSNGTVQVLRSGPIVLD